jgi:hypothetical protein
MNTLRWLPWLLFVACTSREPVLDGDPVDTLDDTVRDTEPPDPGDSPVATFGEPFQDTGVRAMGQLHGGSWRDLDHWETWGELTNFGSDWFDTHAAWGFATTQRFKVVVRDADGTVPDARVLLFRQTEQVFEARTNEFGVAEVWGGLFDLSGGPWAFTTIADDRVLQTLNVRPSWQTPYDLQLTDESLARPDDIDLVVGVDVREDYGEELAWLQGHLGDVIAHGSTRDRPTRVSTLAFDDADVTITPLAEDPTAALAHIDNRDLGGGPAARFVEALEALVDLEWSEHAHRRAAVLMVGKLQASRIDLPRLHAATAALAAQGVRLHTVSLDPEAHTSFVLRDLSAVTNGTWSFLLQPGPPEPTDLVGPFTIEDFEDLLVDQLRGVAPI